MIMILALPVVVSAQVPVEVSAEKIVSGGRVYYLHEVQKSQTLYSISRAYRVTIDAITRENVIPPNGIQTGQVLRIPAPDQQAASVSQPRTPAESQTRPAAQPSRRVLVSDVPGINISNEKIVTGGKTYFMHEVLKGQTLYSIAKAYKVTILDIDRENSIPAGGIREGQVLKIPASSALTVIIENDLPAETAAQPSKAGDAGGGASRTAATGSTLPRQETTRQETSRQGTQLPRQETTRQETSRQGTQLPRQEQPAVKNEPAKQNEGTVTYKANEPGDNTTSKKTDDTKTQPVTGPQQQAQQQAQQQTPAPGRSEDKPKPVQPEKKKIHKVQKGESLSDIAKKYGVSVQELKQANKGVIFAMPDMRLVIPVKDEE
jgi:LysM repeat protein